MRTEADGILLDYARQNATAETLPLLLGLASSAGLSEKIVRAGHCVRRFGMGG